MGTCGLARIVAASAGFASAAIAAVGEFVSVVDSVLVAAATFADFSDWQDGNAKPASIAMPHKMDFIVTYLLFLSETKILDFFAMKQGIINRSQGNIHRIIRSFHHCVFRQR